MGLLHGGASVALLRVWVVPPLYDATQEIAESRYHKPFKRFAQVRFMAPQNNSAGVVCI
jgi:hypothetical protein